MSIRLKMALAALCAWLLASCNVVSAGNEDLLQPPVMNQRQAELQEALDQTMNLRDISFSYPRTGEYRSPFQFIDLDGDGLDEAVVLYSYDSNPDEVRIKVLAQSEPGSWHSVYDVAGRGSRVDFIRFSHLLSSDTYSILVGWSNERGAAVLGAYSYAGDQLEQQYLQQYLGYLLHDFDENGLEELVLVGPALSGSGLELTLLKARSGRLLAVDAVPLEPDAQSVLLMQRGLLWNGETAIYIDEIHENETVATEVFAVLGEQLAVAAGYMSPQDSQLYTAYTSTFREGEVLSVDLYGNEEILVPRMQELPRQAESDSIPFLELTEYRRLTADGYESITHAAVNQPAGYLVFFPARWLGEVTVLNRPEIGEWQFWRVDSDSKEPVTELMRIRVYTAGDYVDRFTENYFLLDTKGAFSYFCYVPRQADPMGVTQQEAMELFQLL